MNWQTIAGMALLIGAVAGTWLVRQPPAQAPSQQATELAPNPGYYLRDGRMLGLDEEGRRLYELRATMIEQQPDQQTVLLEELQIDYTANNQAPWTMLADRGLIPDSGDTIELRGNVRLQRQSTPGGRNNLAMLRTEALDFSARERTASTDAQVQLQSNGHTLHAKGLIADLEAGQVRLRSAVRGRFTP